MILGRKEGARADILLIEGLRREPEHPVPIFFLQRVAEILPSFLGALDDKNAELFESPTLLATSRVEEPIVIPKLPHDGRLTVLVVADL